MTLEPRPDAVSPDSPSEAVSELAVAARAELVRFLALKLHDQTLADDLAQEIYLRLQRLGSLHEIRNPRAYLYRVAATVLADHARGRRRRVLDGPWLAEAEDLPSGDEGPYDRYLHRQRVVRLQAAVRDLPDRCRRALVLHRRDGWTYGEIAHELGVSRSMVKKYLRKALTLCRRALQADGEDR